MREDWVEKELGEICDFLGGGTPSKSNPLYWGGEIPWASIKDIKNDQLLKTQDFITKNGLQNSASNIAKYGEIILATRINPGKPILTKIDTAINQDLKIVKPKVEIDTKYLFYGFKTLEKQVLQISSGTTVLGVNLTNLKSLLFPLAPLPIQRAIVYKIETLFSDLDKGIEDLNKAKEQLKIYRQAVLKKAFEGELTLDWKFKSRVDQKWQKHTFDDVLEIISGKNQKSVENENGLYPIYGSGGVFGFANDYLCDAGTTIIGRKGTINSPIFVNEKFWNVDTAFGLSPSNRILPLFLYYFCTGFNFKKLDKSTTIPSLAKRDLLKIEINLPSIEEQKLIVHEIESRLSVCDQVERSITESLEKAKALRQSILKKAFEGKLLTKAEIERCKGEKDYEAAGVLLERIKRRLNVGIKTKLN